MPKVKVAMALYDIHVPYHNDETINIFKRVFKDLQPDYFIIGGDAVDAENLGRWTKSTVEDGLYKTLDELKTFKSEIYEPVLKLSKNSRLKTFWTLGNHEYRITEALKANPDREQLINLPSMFPEAKFCEYNEFFKIGSLCYTHGEYHNDAHAKKHAITYMSNVLYGHLHTVQSYTSSSKGRGKTYRATSVPCACDLSPKYLKGGANSWTNGFAIINYDSKGNHWINIVEVIDGKAIVNGKIYKA